MKNQILLKISERGNGLPSKGTKVYDSSTDTVYELTADYPGAVIHTGPPGSGNYCYMYGIDCGSASGMADEEWDYIPEVGVEIAEEQP